MDSLSKKSISLSGAVVHTCNPSAWEAETGGSQVQGQPQQFSEALSNLMRPCFQIKNKKGPGMVAHTCNPSAWEAETGGSQVQGQLQQLSEALSNLAKPCFKIKNKKDWGCSSEVECPWVESLVTPQNKIILLFSI